MGAAVLGMVAFLIGIGLYTYAVVNRYIAESFSTASSTAAIIQKVVDVKPLADEVMMQYCSLNAEEREQTGTEADRERFAYITEREDYQALLSVLNDFLISSRLDAVYVAMYDEETSAMDGLKYKEYEIELEPGAKIFLYTDGVPEADNEEKEMFSTQRMLEVLNRNAGETPAVILANTREAIRAFAGTEEQFDDITMLCLEYKGKN